MAIAKLTQKERVVLDFILRWWVEHRVSPSYREMTDGIYFLSGVSHTSYYVKRLVDRGYLAQIPAQDRAMVPVRDVDGCMIELIFRRLDGHEVKAGELEAS